MMDRCDGELELVRKLGGRQVRNTEGQLQSNAYPHEIIQVDSLIAVSLHFDFSSQHINNCFPLQFFWELRQAGPLVAKGFLTERVLLLLDLTTLIIAGLW